MDIGKVFFDTYLKNAKRLTIVDVGSQDVNGSLRSVAPANNKYIGIDFVEGQGVDIVITDPYVLPMENDSVDVVVCSSCFEHSEFFWLLFNEIQRILKPNGLFYLNVPSNGKFHRYPVDCWRFYPDSGIALQNWGRKNGYNTTLLESFTGKQKKDIWNDFAAVFLKDFQFIEKHPDRIQTMYPTFMNGLIYGEEDFKKFSELPEDRLIYLHNNQLKPVLETSQSEIEKLTYEYQALNDYLSQKNLDLRMAEGIFKKMYKHRLRKYALRLLLGRKMTCRIQEWLRNLNFHTKQD